MIRFHFLGVRVILYLYAHVRAFFAQVKNGSNALTEGLITNYKLEPFEDGFKLQVGPCTQNYQHYSYAAQQVVDGILKLYPSNHIHKYYIISIIIL